MITHYMILASIRDSEHPENDLTKDYCKTATDFVFDSEVIDLVLTENEANTIYGATLANGSPYSIVSKIAVYDDGKTEVVTEKTV